MCGAGSPGAATPGCLAAGGATFGFVHSVLSCEDKSADECARGVVVETAAGGFAGYAAELVPGSGVASRLASAYVFGSTNDAGTQLLTTGHINFAQANR